MAVVSQPAQGRHVCWRFSEPSLLNWRSLFVWIEENNGFKGLFSRPPSDGSSSSRYSMKDSVLAEIRFAGYRSMTKNNWVCWYVPSIDFLTALCEMLSRTLFLKKEDSRKTGISLRRKKKLWGQQHKQKESKKNTFNSRINSYSSMNCTRIENFR